MRNDNSHLIHTDALNNPGIYVIANLTSERMYIGSSARLRDGLTSHIWHLRNGRHGNSHLQASWNKHGENSFILCSLQYVDVPELEIIEQEWLEEYHGQLFNMQGATAIKRGFRHSEATRELMSIKSRKNWERPEYREIITAASRGIKRSPETIERNAAAKRGKKASEETKQKMRDAVRKAFPPRTPEHSAKIAATKTKRYVVTSPELVEMRISNLREFCRANNLQQSHMSKVAKGIKLSHKGWLCRYDTTEESPEVI